MTHKTGNFLLLGTDPVVLREKNTGNKWLVQGKAGRQEGRRKEKKGRKEGKESRKENKGKKEGRSQAQWHTHTCSPCYSGAGVGRCWDQEFKANLDNTARPSL